MHSQFEAPAITRWGTHLSCLQSIKKNKNNLKILAISQLAQKKINHDVKLNILDDKFWVGLDQMIKLLTPICTWMRKLECDQSKISDVPQVFIDLFNHFSDFFKSGLCMFTAEEKHKCMRKLSERKKWP